MTNKVSNKGKKLNKDPKRFERKMPPGPMEAPLTIQPRPKDSELCQRIEDIVNDQIRKVCAQKEFEQTTGNCCTESGKKSKVDLVIVIDTSGSMSDEASDLSAAADAAIQAAAKSCPSDLRVDWFGIEGTWPGTKFTQSYRDHLGAGPFVPPLVGTAGDLEDGAGAVIDLSRHYAWRPDAARTIFYLGDEALEGGDPQNAADVAAADAAIAVANAQNVKLFTYFGTGAGNPITAAEYARLANDTGGQAFSAPIANLGGFQPVLEEIICKSGCEKCSPIEIPDCDPCIRLHWGDGPKDCLETEDTEILCITVCNPYCNVILADFTMQLVITDEAGNPVATLPDGTPSVRIKPDYMICFGDIPPCDPKKPDDPSCISREIVLLTCGALEGKYKIRLVYCFDACFTKLDFDRAFEIELVKS